jgi:hypothetical protein
MAIKFFERIHILDDELENKMRRGLLTDQKIKGTGRI